MSGETGLWFWVQPHCKCGWIGEEQSDLTTESVRGALRQLGEHRETMHGGKDVD